MTWLYVPSSSAPDTAASPSDSEISTYEPWLTLSGTATQRPFSSPVWKKRGWIKRLSGTISAPLTAQLGVDEWISSLPVSPANHSQQQACSEVSMMSDGSGPTLQGSLLTFNPDTSSWRTSPDLFGQVLDTSSPTLPASGSMRNGVCSPRPPLVPLIDANVSGSWPTPRAHDGTSGGDAPSSHPQSGGMGLQQAAKTWPTLQAHDAKGVGPSETERHTPSLGMQALMWPTPTTKDTNLVTSELNPDGKHGMELRRAAGHFHLAQTTGPDGLPGQPQADLNPQFVASLMGVPKDWLTPYTSEETV